MGLFTVGHSTRSLDELVDLLRAHDVALLGDVRTVPASRRVPHFGRAVLAQELPERGVEYQHLPALALWEAVTQILFNVAIAAAAVHSL